MSPTKNSVEIGRKCSLWVQSQKDLAADICISQAAICKMFSGAAALPLPRFLQIVHALKPPRAEVEEVFGLYLDELDIPAADMALIFKGYSEDNLTPTLRESIHKIVDSLDDRQLAALLPVLNLMGGNGSR
jgi:hypothetical protein